MNNTAAIRGRASTEDHRRVHEAAQLHATYDHANSRAKLRAAPEPAVDGRTQTAHGLVCPITDSCYFRRSEVIQGDGQHLAIRGARGEVLPGTGYAKR